MTVTSCTVADINGTVNVSDAVSYVACSSSFRPKKKAILLTPKNAVRPADAADAAKQQSSQSEQKKTMADRTRPAPATQAYEGAQALRWKRSQAAAKHKSGTGSYLCQQIANLAFRLSRLGLRSEELQRSVRAPPMPVTLYTVADVSGTVNVSDEVSYDAGSSALEVIHTTRVPP